jgi:RP/EB family microtubule-associated protein
MARVKMQAKHEYEYVANYKIMQNVFKAKKIDKPIPVEKLVKCKMQCVSFSTPYYFKN